MVSDVNLHTYNAVKFTQTGSVTISVECERLKNSSDQQSNVEGNGAEGGGAGGDGVFNKARPVKWLRVIYY